MLQDGKQLTLDARIKTIIDQDSYSLVIMEAMPQDTGTYECIARNTKGEARARSHVSVLCKWNKNH